MLIIQSTWKILTQPAHYDDDKTKTFADPCRCLLEVERSHLALVIGRHLRQVFDYGVTLSPFLRLFLLYIRGSLKINLCYKNHFYEDDEDDEDDENDEDYEDD